MNKYQEALDFVKNNMLYWDYYDDCDLPQEYYKKKEESLQLLQELVSNSLQMQDLDLIVFCALRYALGRRTYIVNVVTDFIKDNLSLFTSVDIAHLAREIEKAAEEDNLGDDIDKAVWLSLLKDLRQEQEKREEGQKSK